MVVVVGYALPKRHVASRTVVVAQPADRVWRAITHVEAMPTWRSGIQRVELTSADSLRPAWREVSKNGTISFEVVESVPQRRLVSRIADRNLPFGGSWTYELVPVTGGTQLSIREDGEVHNPIYRFVSRFVLGHHATMDEYIASLQKHLGGV
jgi:uncharacterized protein YndB with AHSA1/START domain